MWPPQALVNCLELLEDDDTHIRICGCKALACIKVRSHRALTLWSRTMPVQNDCMHVYAVFICLSTFVSFKAEESIDQLVYVCATDQEEVRDAAKQALLVLGNIM